MEQNNKTDKLLEVRDLQVSFFTPAGEVKAVNGISYDLDYNEVMGVVGESGSGKSVEAYSIIGLLQQPSCRFHPQFYWNLSYLSGVVVYLLRLPVWVPCVPKH